MTRAGSPGHRDQVMRALRRTAKRAGRRAGLLRRDTHTELVIGAAFAADVLEGWTASRRGLVRNHHLTLLDPFVPSPMLDDEVLAGVEAVLADYESFTYDLVRVARFPGVLYLEPDPADQFVAMTEALWRRFPAYPPYGGAFAEIVPHVTLALGPEPPGLAEHVSERLPVSGRVDGVHLYMENASGDWGVGRRFPLPGGARTG